MDSQQILKQLFNGSRSQRRRKEELDKKKKNVLNANKADKEKKRLVIDAQFCYILKIHEGVKNTKRTIAIRLFFLRFQNKALFERGKRIKNLIKDFERWICDYERTIKQETLDGEEKINKHILPLLQSFEKEKKDLEEEMKKQQGTKNKATLTFFLVILTTIILLFKETKEVEYNKDIFDETKRWNPLNPIYPFIL